VSFLRVNVDLRHTVNKSICILCCILEFQSEVSLFVCESKARYKIAFPCLREVLRTKYRLLFVL